MRFLSLTCLAFVLAACGSAQKAGPPAPVVVQVPEKGVAFTQPDGWQSQGTSESAALQVTCDIRLTLDSAHGEMCALIVPDEQEPFMDVPPEIQPMLLQQLADNGWAEAKLTIDPSRKLFTYSGNRTIALVDGQPPALLRLHYLRMALPGDESRAVLMMAYVDAAQGPSLDAAVQTFAASLNVVPVQK